MGIKSWDKIEKTMNKLVKKGIKSLKGIKKDAIIYAKDTYNEFAKPVVKTISRNIEKIDWNGIYKDGVKAADAAIYEVRSFAKKSDKLIKISSNKVIRTAFVKTAQKRAIIKLKRAQKFINKRLPLAKAAVIGFATVNVVKAEAFINKSKKYVNKTYPKVQKFVKANYPNVKVWVAGQLPKIEAFLAGQLSARVQKFAA
jgi:hypothetical protein